VIVINRISSDEIRNLRVARRRRGLSITLIIVSATLAGALLSSTEFNVVSLVRRNRNHSDRAQARILGDSWARLPDRIRPAKLSDAAGQWSIESAEGHDGSSRIESGSPSRTRIGFRGVIVER